MGKSSIYSLNMVVVDESLDVNKIILMLILYKIKE